MNLAITLSRAQDGIGELALGGERRAVLPAVLQAARCGRRVVMPNGNGAEAALLANADVRVAGSPLEVCVWLDGRTELPHAHADAAAHADTHEPPDLADVRGQSHARRALEIAAAGAHNLPTVGLNKAKASHYIVQLARAA